MKRWGKSFWQSTAEEEQLFATKIRGMVTCDGEEKFRDPRRALGRKVTAFQSSGSRNPALAARGTFKTFKEKKIMFL